MVVETFTSKNTKEINKTLNYLIKIIFKVINIKLMIGCFKYFDSPKSWKK